MEPMIDAKAPDDIFPLTTTPHCFLTNVFLCVLCHLLLFIYLFSSSCIFIAHMVTRLSVRGGGSQITGKDCGTFSESVASDAEFPCAREA